MKISRMKRPGLTILLLLLPMLLIAAGTAPVIEQGDAPLEVSVSSNGTPTSWTAPTLSAFDLEGDTLTWGLVTGATPTGVIPGRLKTPHGVAHVEGTGVSPARFFYQPDPGGSGRDSFTVGVSDGSRIDTIQIFVNSGGKTGRTSPLQQEKASAPAVRDSLVSPAADQPVDYTLIIIIHGAGQVRTNLAGFSCRAVCGQGFPAGFAVELTVEPDPGQVFTGWDGACSGTADCHLRMDQDISVEARFSPGVRSPDARHN